MRSLPLLTLILITTIFSTPVFAQRTISATLKGISAASPKKLVIAKDGSSIVCSSDPNWDGFTGILIARISQDGDYLWTKTYITSTYRDYISTIAPTEDNGFIFTVYNVLSSYPVDGILIIKCDSLGNIEWKKKISSTLKGYMFSGVICQTKDKGYYFSCLGENLFLFKLTSSGNVEWNKVYDAPAYGGGYGIGIEAVAEAPGGGAIISVSEIGCDYYCVWNYLFRFSKSGNLVSGTEISIPGKESPQLHAMVSDNKTVHFLYEVYGAWTGIRSYCYMTYELETGKSKANLIPADIFSLKAFFQKNSISALNDIGFPSNSYSYSAIRNNGQVVKVEGVGYPSAVKFNQYDSKGRVCPDFTLPLINDTSATRHIGTSALSIAVSNEGFEITDVDVIVNSINDFTEICSGEATEQTNAIALLTNVQAEKQQSNVTAKVSPNPVSDFTVLELYSAKTGIAEISIAGLDGKVVLKEKISVSKGFNKTIISTQFFTKGMYILRVNNGNQEKTIKLLKM